MKKLISLVALIAIWTSILFSQAPLNFKYQGVARDANGQIVRNKTISLKLSILENSATGPLRFAETHKVTTSDLGIFNLHIGAGNIQVGSMNSISWQDKNQFLKVELDINGGSNYIEMGTSQFLSVPYALHASTVENNNDADADPSNEIQQLGLNGDTLSLTKSNSIRLNNFKSPWREVSLGIAYDKGIVYADEHQVDVSMRVGNNTPTRTQMLPNEIMVDYSNLDGSVSSLKGNQLRIYNMNPSNRHSELTLDSLEYFRAGVGLLYDSRSVLDPESLRLEFGSAASQIAAGSLIQTTGLHNSILYSNALRVEEILSPSDIFTRFSLEPDSLTLWNSTKWKNAWLGTESVKGNGGLHLYSGGNDRPIALLGDSDPSNFFGAPPEGGLFLFDKTGNTKASIGSNNGSGQMLLQNKDSYSGAGDGSFGAGVLSSFGSFNILTTKFLAGVNQNSGYLNIYGEYPSGQLSELYSKAGMKVNPGGLGNVYSDGWFNIKYPGTDMYSTQMNYLGVQLFDSLGTSAASITRDLIFPQIGYLQAYGENTSLNFYAGANWENGNTSGGFASVCDNNGNFRAGMEVDASNSGRLFANGYNGTQNFLAGYNFFTGNVNTGSATVADENGIHKAGMYIDPAGNGVLFADLKNFRVKHPVDHTKEIWYASLEGPEAGAYIRGTASLIHGEAIVSYPEHFLQIANTSSMTVTLTPLFADTYGLAVVEKMQSGFKVKELKSGNGNFSFDWEVKCVRIGYEEFKVVRETMNPQTTSSMK